MSIRLASRPDVRGFRIITPKGTIDLLDKKHLAISISGLGVGFDDKFNKIKTQYSVHTRNPKFDPIKFSLSIGHEDDPYLVYEELSRLLNHDRLIFEYDALDRRVYNRDVALMSITKGEIGPYGVLVCDVELQPLSLWYRWREVKWGERIIQPYVEPSLKPPVVDNTQGKPWLPEELQTGQFRIITNESIFMDTKQTSALWMEFPSGFTYGEDVFGVYTPLQKLIGNFAIARQVRDDEKLYYCTDYNDMWALVKHVYLQQLEDISSGISSDSVGFFRAPQDTIILKISDALFAQGMSFQMSNDQDPANHIRVKIKEEWVMV